MGRIGNPYASNLSCFHIDSPGKSVTLEFTYEFQVFALSHYVVGNARRTVANNKCVQISGERHQSRFRFFTGIGHFLPSSWLVHFFLLKLSELSQACHLKIFNIAFKEVLIANQTNA